MHILYPFAKRFIAGENLQAAIKSTEKLHAGNYLTSMDLLGEHVRTADQADQAREEYLKLTHELADSPWPRDFSIKLSQMGLEIDRDLCIRNVADIIKASRDHTFRLDMEGSDDTQATIDICKELHETHKNLGLVLQAYLFRTESDVDDMIDRGISVRLCKGAYKEPPSIAYQSMNQIRNNFLPLAHKLLKEGFQPAIATHDEHLLEKILAFIEKENIDAQSFYFEMLYGVRRDLQKILLEKGYRVRIYVPFGKTWLPYPLRRLAEKKENTLFVINNLFRETFGLSRLD
jgi:proline dehydrogenase